MVAHLRKSLEDAPTPASFSRRTWHRRATKPISYWMMALIVVVLIHPLVPQFRWLLVHMVALGLVTTSIMVWGQHFAEALLKTKLPDESRPLQVRRINLLTLAIAVTMLGMVMTWPLVTVIGAAGVSAVTLWYAWSLGNQVKASIAPRFSFVVRFYQVAACLLPVGAILGSIMAFSMPEPLQGGLMLAHQIANILGFVGVTASATLLTLWPTVLRTKLDSAKATRATRSLTLMVIGTLVGVLGAVVNNLLVGVAGIGLYVVGQLSIALLLFSLARQAVRQERREPIPLFPALSMGAGILWFVGTPIALIAMWARSSGGLGGEPVASPLNFSLTSAEIQQLTVPFVVGFLLQLLLGAMSFLMPTAMGGGPRALRASLREMSRFAVFRVVVLNLTLALFAFSQIEGALGSALFGTFTLGTFGPAQFGSVTRVLTSLAAFAVLLMFLVLLKRMIAVNKKERIEFQQRVALGTPTAGLPTRGMDVSGNEEVPTGAGQPSGPTPSLPRAQSLTEATMGHGPGYVPPSGTVGRRDLASALAGMGTVLGLAAMGRGFDGTLGAAAAAAPEQAATPTGTPTGKTTRVHVAMTEAMRFEPSVIEVPAGDTLEIELHNADPANVHDLLLDTGAYSGRVNPGDTQVFDAGVIGGPVEGWCSIVGHKAMGMTLTINTAGAASAHAEHSPTPAAAGESSLARVTGDLAAAPGESHSRRDPVMPPVPQGEQNLTFTVTEAPLEIAPGVAMNSMVYNGTVMGPVIVSPIGGRVNLTLVNNGTMGHSIDFHAGRVAPNVYMKTIAVGESLEYPFTTDYAGAYLYHCSTAPMTVHLSSGMYGVLIVPPQGIQSADREYVLVQSEHYLEPAQALDAQGGALAGPAGTTVHNVSAEKIAAERPDFTVFNGHATQYVAEPLEAKVGERVRIWVLAAGPSRGISFHVVGAVFDTVFKEGEYVLRPENETGGGAQALDLASCQGGFVEMVFTEPGIYKAVNHSFVELERGALALINVTE